ncbi:hypothetical protein CsSME_00030475 [Camellia sinensis var. sinensis]
MRWGDFDSDEMRLKISLLMGLKEFCIWSFVKQPSSQLEKKENKNWVVYNYHEF